MSAVAERPSFPASTGEGSAFCLDVLSPAPLSERELIEWVRSEREGAAARLYDRYAGLINHVVLRVLGGDAEHDDIVHDAFLKVWKLIHEGKVHTPESLASWVATVTTHVVYKEIRKRYMRRRFFGREEPAPAALAHHPDLEAREGLRVVYAIASELPPAERLAFTLRHLGQHALAETARLCDCSLATIKRRLARAEAHFVARAHDYPEYPRLMTLLDAGGEP